MEKFTDQQIADYRSYESVRASGMFNMFDPRAQVMAGLSKDEYTFVMKNFTALRLQEDATRR